MSEMLKVVKKLSEAIEATTKNDKFVVMIAYQDGGNIVHTYEMGESITPEEFCHMAVELIVGAYGTAQGWMPPEGSKPFS